ncbi:hypothetical protein AN958_06856 [Leucoagaricus sp. SymC.cos]|nr:hypothetical protein AN958_06856 [Leucoagaricus sp. SymC.cos]
MSEHPLTRTRRTHLCQHVMTLPLRPKTTHDTNLSTLLSKARVSITSRAKQQKRFLALATLFSLRCPCRLCNFVGEQSAFSFGLPN